MKTLSTIGIIFLFLLPALTFAQAVNDEKVEKYQSQWNKLMPRQAKLQFAGSMGMFSLGSGWYYGKNSQWETDLFIGFIPRIDDMKGHLTMTLKQTYVPFQIKFSETVRFEPLTGGAYINKIFGPYFWNTLPDRYPKNYYFWATNTRFNVFLGQAISFRQGKNLTARSWSFYYEVNTNDLYFISAIGNKTIKITDILNLSFGLRYRLF